MLRPLMPDRFPALCSCTSTASRNLTTPQIVVVSNMMQAGLLSVLPGSVHSDVLEFGLP